MDEKINLSVVIPVYNEQETIKQTISEIKQALSDQELDWEIIAVNDFSKDESRNIIESLPDVKLINHPYNKGYGASLKTGIKNSKYQWVAIIDGDGTYPATAIPELIKYAKEYDMVSGNRTGKHRDRRWLYSQKLAKYILVKLANYVTNSRIDDINCGLRIYKKNVLMKYWSLYPERFSFTATSLLAFLNNSYAVKFVPITYYERSGKSGIKPIKDFYGFINLILKISLYFQPLKIFIPISLTFLLLAILVIIYSIFLSDKFLDTTTIILAVSSVQTLFFGLLAELIVKKDR